MKLLFVSILLAISMANAYSQVNTLLKENIIIIIEQTDPVISDFLFCNKGNLEVLEEEYQYDFKYGDFVKRDEPFRENTYNYNSDGVLEVDYFDNLVKLGKKGEQLNKPYLKYKYNDAGEIVELFEYSAALGELDNRYVFHYNSKNQIIKVVKYKGESKNLENIITYTYNEIGKRTESLTYTPTSNTSFPKFESFKSKWIYDDLNRLISYKSYQNRYGYYPNEQKKYVNGKYINKSLAENLKQQKESWKEDVLYEYAYSEDNTLWITRKEYKNKPNSVFGKEYFKVIERVYNSLN